MKIGTGTYAVGDFWFGAVKFFSVEKSIPVARSRPEISWQQSSCSYYRLFDKELFLATIGHTIL